MATRSGTVRVGVDEVAFIEWSNVNMSEAWDKMLCSPDMNLKTRGGEELPCHMYLYIDQIHSKLFMLLFTRPGSKDIKFDHEAAVCGTEWSSSGIGNAELLRDGWHVLLLIQKQVNYEDIPDKPVRINIRLACVNGDVFIHSGCDCYKPNIGEQELFGDLFKVQGDKEKKQLITIKVGDGDEVLEIEKKVLEENSPVFAVMFENEMRENESGEIEMIEYEVDVVQALLYYFFTKQLPDRNKLMNLICRGFLDIASKYDVEGLVEMIREYMNNTDKLEMDVKVENVSSFCRVCDIHDVGGGRRFATDFIIENHQRVVNSENWKEVLQGYGKIGGVVFEAMSRKAAITPKH